VLRGSQAPCGCRGPCGAQQTCPSAVGSGTGRTGVDVATTGASTFELGRAAPGQTISPANPHDRPTEFTNPTGSPPCPPNRGKSRCQRSRGSLDISAAVVSTRVDGFGVGGWAVIAVRGGATRDDVARRAGVSSAVVSYVVNDGPRAVAPETKRRVLTAIEELRYEPNSQARNLRRGRSHSIGLIVPDILNPFFALVAEGIQEEARLRDYLLVLCSSDFESEREAGYARLLRASRLDGVVHLSGTGASAEPLLELAEGAPLVVVDERVGGLDRPFVGSDNRRGARLAAEFALERGYRRFGIVAGPAGLWTAQQRLAGYHDAFSEAGIDPAGVPIIEGDYRIDSGAAAAANLLARRRRRLPMALLVANDLMAVGCLLHCAKAGLTVPDDVGVVGYDDVPLAAIVTPGLTTVRQPARELGRVAARILLDLIEGGEVEQEVDLPAELVVRESLGVAS
jgi:DNA-binding LacI/PurR family transcriptional regulator